LCAGATSDAPAWCFSAVRDFKFGADDRVALCRGAANAAAATAAAHCASSAPAALSTADKVALCAGLAANSNGGGGGGSGGGGSVAIGNRSEGSGSFGWVDATAPGRCFSQAPAALGVPARVVLCAGAASTGPAECARTAGTGEKEE
ncbi:unnamed protein product, partial [Phaeothamnion confervicola]